MEIKLSLQMIVAIFAVAVSLAGFVGEWYVNSYRLDQLEKQVATNQADIQWLLGNAVAHGWQLPPEMIGH